MSLKAAVLVPIVATVCLWSGRLGWSSEDPPLGLGWEEIPHPDENAPTEAAIGLGEKLFFDKILSRDGSLACATCHVPEQAFAQKGESVSKGVDGKLGRRNSPSVLNVAFAEKLFHDGRSLSLEDQAWQPILADDEMGNRSKKEVLDRLSASQEYVGLFKKAFGVERPDEETVAKALASYQRTLLSGNSLFDQWNWGGEDTLSEQAQAGYVLFAGQAQCWQCHPLNSDGALLFTDHIFHDTGVAARSARIRKAKGLKPLMPDLGRYEVTKREIDRFQFKTPSLRNVALTPPYMHDGSIPSLKEVVEFYNRAEDTSEVSALNMSEKEIASLVAFLESLSGTKHGMKHGTKEKANPEH